MGGGGEANHPPAWIGLNKEIPKFSQWLTTNKLSLNINKTKFMIFKLRQKTISFQIQIQAKPTLNKKEIEQVKEKSFLGVVLEEHLTLIEVSCYPCGQQDFQVYWINPQIKFSLIYPFLQYCNLVWAST